LIASFFIGIVGFSIFLYGKKQQRIPHLVAGLVLMIYPYFVPGVVAMVAIAVALLGILAVAVKKEWV
jgi:hypothetical protein